MWVSQMVDMKYQSPEILKKTQVNTGELFQTADMIVPYRWKKHT